MSPVLTVLLCTGLIFFAIVGVICLASRKLDAVIYFTQIVFSFAYMYSDIKFFHRVHLNELVTDWSHPSVPELIMWSMEFLFIIAAGLWATVNLIWIIRADPVGRMLGNSRDTDGSGSSEDE